MVGECYKQNKIWMEGGETFEVRKGNWYTIAAVV